ncbi:protein RIC-3 isoform B [Alligator mississippiensis]|uniref:Protein RIC-3 isoform B n=1 Tax=Alligator mississippiensis TaxID=8496 RepID=A0A151MC65_ALLMI|nr:protein RIC-3 isoform B [Alligator mississippiensis]
MRTGSRASGKLTVNPCNSKTVGLTCSASKSCECESVQRSKINGTGRTGVRAFYEAKSTEQRAILNAFRGFASSRGCGALPSPEPAADTPRSPAPEEAAPRGDRRLAEPIAAPSPAGRKQVGAGRAPGKTDRFPPMMPHQIIPIYGFGIFLYILYILFKLSSKGKTTTGERKCPSTIPGNMNRKISDYELTQLQEKLRETEEAMEKLINRVGSNCDSGAQNVATDQEKRLLQQLREITRVMKEGKLIDGISPEKEAEEAPYMEDWEGRDSHETGQKENEQPSFSNTGGVLHPSHNFETCYCCHCEEDDPAVVAENAGFHSDTCSEAEEPTKENLAVESDSENAAVKIQAGRESSEAGALRKRNTKVHE